MKKKILIGSILAALLMLSMPVISSIQVQHSARVTPSFQQSSPVDPSVKQPDQAAELYSEAMDIATELAQFNHPEVAAIGREMLSILDGTFFQCLGAKAFETVLDGAILTVMTLLEIFPEGGLLGDALGALFIVLVFHGISLSYWIEDNCAWLDGDSTTTSTDQASECSLCSSLEVS